MYTKAKELIKHCIAAGFSMSCLILPCLAADFPTSRFAMGERPRLSAMEVRSLATKKFALENLKYQTGEGKAEKALAETLAFSALYSTKCSKNDDTLRVILAILTYINSTPYSKEYFIDKFLKPEMRSIVKIYGEGPNLCMEFARLKDEADFKGWSYFSVMEQIQKITDYRRIGDINEDYKFLRADANARETDKYIDQVDIKKFENSVENRRPLSRPDYPYNGEQQVIDEAIERNPALKIANIFACQSAAKPHDEYIVSDMKVIREVKSQDNAAKTLIISLQDRSYAQRWLDKQGEYHKNGFKVIDDRKTYYYVCSFGRNDQIRSIEIYMQERVGDPILSKKISL